jgi:hypothetical protein
MIIRLWIVVGVAALFVANEAMAQSTSLFGSSGPRGQSTNASRASSSSQSSSGSMQSPTGATGGGGARSGGTGAAGAGSGGAFQGTQLRDTGDLSAQAVGTGTGFVGGANAGFVGDRMAGATGAAGMSMMQRPSFGALGAGGGSDFNSQNRSQQGQSATRNFRPRYRVGFEYTPTAASLSQRTAATVNRLTTRNPALAGLEIVVDDVGMAEIRGTAPNADARTLIENVVRLEPGVRGVTNLIVVAPPAAANP